MSQIINTISEPRAEVQARPSGFALFRYGFRPFFLFGALFGLAAITYFILSISGAVAFLPSRWDAVVWHRHEMLFGFTGAVIAGFLFTAVPNWTGHPTPKGWTLAMIVLLWFAGRFVVFASAYFPVGLAAAVDASFFLACIGGILPALVKSGNRRNYFFIGLLALLAVANGLSHWEDANDTKIAATGIRLALNIIIFMMVVVGGRVIPFFTEKPLGIAISRDPRIERFTLISTAAALALDVAEVNTTILGAAFLLAAIANGWRLSQWRSRKTLRTPLLWILHAGYAWLVLGLAMRAAYNFGFDIPGTIATHAFTAGGIGALTLGMMARVSLGHSGRQLAVGRPMAFAFACVNVAAAFRVFGVWLLPGLSMQWFEAAALLWLLAFGIFVIVYAPILMRPRADGRDG